MNIEKKVKREVWKIVDISIERVVEQHKDGMGMANKTVGYAVEIKKGTTVMSFTEDDPQEIWDMIKREVCLK